MFIFRETFRRGHLEVFAELWNQPNAWDFTHLDCILDMLVQEWPNQEKNIEFIKVIFQSHVTD